MGIGAWPAPASVACFTFKYFEIDREIWTVGDHRSQYTRSRIVDTGIAIYFEEIECEDWHYCLLDYRIEVVFLLLEEGNGWEYPLSDSVGAG